MILSKLRSQTDTHHKWSQNLILIRKMIFELPSIKKTPEIILTERWS